MIELGSERTKQEMRLINQKLAMDGFRLVTYFTPIDTGYLRNNWDVVVDEVPPVGPAPPPEKDKKYGEPNVSGDFRTIKYNSVIIIYNNTEYAIYVEEGTPFMLAQPMVHLAEQALFYEAEKLCNSLSNKRVE